jgi:hypothetical protein
MFLGNLVMRKMIDMRIWDATMNAELPLHPPHLRRPRPHRRWRGRRRLDHVAQPAGASRRRARLAGSQDRGRRTAGRRSIDLSGVISGVGRLGDRMAITDPSQLSALRAKLVQAGYFNREAVAIYLGAKARR